MRAKPIVFLLVMLMLGFGARPAPARDVECPAVWPGDTLESRLTDADVYIDDDTQPPWEESQHGTRVEDVVYGAYVDLQCLYTNGRLLFIPLHGDPLHGDEKECHTIFEMPVDSNGGGIGPNFHIRTYCKLNAHDSADAAQGPVVLTEFLTRHSDILGFRLDMTRDEIDAAIDGAGGTDVVRDADSIRAELADGRKVSVRFRPSGRIQEIAIDSFKLPEHDFYHLIERRFGMTSDRMFPGWRGRWTSGDGTVIEVDAHTGVLGKPHTVGSIDAVGPQQIRIRDATVE